MHKLLSCRLVAGRRARLFWASAGCCCGASDRLQLQAHVVIASVPLPLPPYAACKG